MDNVNFGTTYGMSARGNVVVTMVGRFTAEQMRAVEPSVARVVFYPAN